MGNFVSGMVQTHMRLDGGNLSSGGKPGPGVELHEEAVIEHLYAPQGLLI